MQLYISKCMKCSQSQVSVLIEKQKKFKVNELFFFIEKPRKRTAKRKFGINIKTEIDLIM